jgi:hypothetical protein
MLLGREHGPLAFRLITQPIVAGIIAIRAGLQDARTGRPPYGWAILTQSGRRLALLGAGWKDVARLFIVAVIIDIIYELIVFGWVYPGQALIVAATLAVPSYLLIRGPANRIAQHWYPGTDGAQQGAPAIDTALREPREGKTLQDHAEKSARKHDDAPWGHG